MIGTYSSTFYHAVSFGSVGAIIVFTLSAVLPIAFLYVYLKRGGGLEKGDKLTILPGMAFLAVFGISGIISIMTPHDSIRNPDLAPYLDVSVRDAAEEHFGDDTDMYLIDRTRDRSLSIEYDFSVEYDSGSGEYSSVLVVSDESRSEFALHEVSVAFDGTTTFEEVGVDDTSDDE